MQRTHRGPAGTRRRRIPRASSPLQEQRSRQRQDRRQLFPRRPPPAAHARRPPGSDRPVPAPGGPQRALPQARAAPNRAKVGVGPRTQRPGAGALRTAIPPSPRRQGHRSVLPGWALAPARLRLRCDAARWPPKPGRRHPGALCSNPPASHRQCSPRRAPRCSPTIASRRCRQFGSRSPCIARHGMAKLPKARHPPLLFPPVWSPARPSAGSGTNCCTASTRVPPPCTPTPRSTAAEVNPH